MIIRFLKYCWITPYKPSWRWWLSCIVNILLVIIAIILLCLIFTFICKKLFKCTGQIGDTIGGITAPIIGLISIWLLYITFREQRRFNEKQLDFDREQLHFNEWESLKSILSRIENNLTVTFDFDIYEKENEPKPIGNKSIRIMDIRSLLTQFTNYIPKLHPDEGYKLYTVLKDCYEDINLLIHLTPPSSVYKNIMKESIVTIIEKITPIYTAITNGRIQFIPNLQNLDEDGSLKNLVKYLNADKALFEKLPSEYLPDKHKKE